MSRPNDNPLHSLVPRAGAFLGLLALAAWLVRPDLEGWLANRNPAIASTKLLAGLR